MATKGASKTTTNHEEIRRWVESRGGFPAHVKRTAAGDDPGVLRIDYPGFSGTESLETIDWDEFFEWFDKNNLAFVYQDAGDSRFSKLVDRKTVRARKSGKRKANKRTATGGASRKGATKKSASKKTSSTKSASRKTASRKTASKKSASRKGAAKKTATKKGGTKTGAAKKSATKTAARRKK